MAQQLLPYQYEEDRGSSGMTALAGLPMFLELMLAAELFDAIARCVRVRAKKGWPDVVVVTALVLLNIAGGGCVDDLRVLAADEGFRRILQRAWLNGLGRRERRALEREMNKAGQPVVPSVSATFRYLEEFHDVEQEALRQPHKAFIPAPTAPLAGLGEVNQALVGFVQSRFPQSQATLDMDATLVPADKEEALFCYKGFKAYQPINVRWAEQDLVVYSELRDGNVPASFENLRVFKAGLAALPEGVEKVNLRSDTAAYERDVLQYCARGLDPRFKVIEFAIGADVTVELKKAVAEVAKEDWKPLYRVDADGTRLETEQEWAAVCYVPNWAAHSKREPDYQFIATRERLVRQIEISGLQEKQQELPFPTITLEKLEYKLHALVTNRTSPGDEVIRWYRQRCGKSEEVHAVMKHDLAGGTLPSGKFGVNAAWWAIMILSLNLLRAFQRLVLGGAWVSKRAKALRFGLINLAGRVIHHARSFIIRLTRDHPMLACLQAARARIQELAYAPSG